MAITITTSNGNAKIVNQNGLTTHIAVGLLLFDKGTNGVVEVANAAEDGVLLARGVITDFTIDGTGLTDENYDAVLTALKSSAVQVPVSISDPDLTDLSQDTVIYNAWKIADSGNYKIQKIDITDDGISRLYAIGLWADRATLIYE